MNSFKIARLKLTIWYVLFVMLLSSVFSFGAYKFLAMELDQSLRSQALRLYSQQRILIAHDEFADIYEEARSRILYHILLLNGGIFVLSTITAYLLAGKTLQPLEQAVEEQKRFIADASHELKTPLTSMRTEIEVAMREKKMTVTELRKLVQSNLEEVDKMKQLTNYLLSLSQYEDKSSSIQFKSVLASNIISGSIQRVKLKAEEREILIKENIKDFKLRANVQGLEDLCVILLDNAIKYSSFGKTIEIRAFSTRNHGVIEIKDQGIGIKSSDIPYIFNRFYRADTSRTKQKIDGYGLGLSIAKSIVDLHKGKIEVKSRVGEGTTFTITLPR